MSVRVVLVGAVHEMGLLAEIIVPLPYNNELDIAHSRYACPM